MASEFPDTCERLPRTSYFDPAWFEREKRQLFDHAWTFACPSHEVSAPGDFQTLRFVDHSLAVVRDADGVLRGHHNICRHRGCEVLEGSGNTGDVIRCPYHRWVYRLDGSLWSLPNAECFPALEREHLALHPAAVGEWAGMVFINPDPDPPESLETWLANLSEFAWPHNLNDGSLVRGGSVTHEMHCNWKLFYENAVDGYHLGYLHDQTLGSVVPGRNTWRRAGRNALWFSTERDGPPQSSSVLNAQTMDAAGVPRLAGHDVPTYPGVVMLFPLTIIWPNPWSLSVSRLEPVAPEQTNMHTVNWVPAGSPGRFDLVDARKGEQVVRLADLDQHPLETRNFQIEDMWIVEKIQRSVRSPRYELGPLARGAGAEDPVAHFQASVLELLGGEG